METPAPHPGPAKAAWIDIASRVVGVAVFGGLLVREAVKVWRFLCHPNWSASGAVSYAFVAAEISIMLFLGLVVVLFVVRLTPAGKSEGLVPRAIALAAAFTPALLVLLPQAQLPLWVLAFSILLVAAGYLGSMAALAVLGRSFSILPEARKLVTRGPYALVRHPIYFFEITAVVGMTMQFLSAPAVLILVLHVSLQLWRMRFEEAVLQRALPEYAEYARVTKRLIPGIY